MCGGAWAPRTRRGRGPGNTPPSPRGCQDSERARSLRTPRGCPGLGEGASDSTSWTPCSRGQAHDPPALALPLFPERGHPVLHKPARPGRPFVHTAAVGGSEGAQPQTLAFLLLFFFFFAFGREKKQSVRFCPIYVSTWEQTLVVCVCFFLCWFFKEMGRRKKKNSLPFPRSCSPPSVLPTSLLPPFLFCCFCFATSPHSCL